MKLFSPKLSRSGLLSASVASTCGSLIERADNARDAQRWKEAAGYYAEAVRCSPHRADLLVQRANCHKEAGDYTEAFFAYCDSLRVNPNADCDLQLGHLLKLSGNFNAARRAYQRAAAAGDNRADIELEAFSRLSPRSAILLPGSKSGSDKENILIHAALDIAACDIEDRNIPSALRKAAASLSLAQQADLARNFHQIAYLEEITGAATSDKLSSMLRSSLWPLSHMSELSDVETQRAAKRPETSYERMLVLVGVIVDTLAMQERAPIQNNLQQQLRTSRWPPESLSVRVDEDGLNRLAAALTDTYNAFALADEQEGERVIDSIRALTVATSPSVAKVAFFQSATERDLRKLAARTLNDSVANWIVRVESRFLNRHATPPVVMTSLMLGVSPVSERLEELGSPAAVIHEILAAASVRLDPPTPELQDLVLAGVLADWLPDATPTELSGVFDQVLQGDLPHSAQALIGEWSLSMLMRNGGAVGVAQRLKHAGMPQAALDLLDRHIDEINAPVAHLTEKALIAKINGDFAQSARLLELCAAREPDNTFVRRELCTVLPEIESLDHIIERLRGDALFMEVASERPFYRSSMGRELIDVENSLVESDVRIVDLAPEIAAELHNVAPVGQEKEEICVLELGWLRRRGFSQERRVLRNVDFVRVLVSSTEPITQLRVRIDGKTITTCNGVRQSSPQRGKANFHRMIFNCWFDLSDFKRGWHDLQLYFEEKRSGYRIHEELVWIEPEPPTPEMLSSAAAVDLTAAAPAPTLDERIASLPSVVYEAERKLFSGALDRILVIRADQLGDTSQSIPAMFELAAAFPQARIECLTSPGNVELLTSLGLFAEVHQVTSTYDKQRRKRYVSLNEQLRLCRMLAPKRFDLAIDLSPGFETQNLLKLARARHTAGFKPNDFRWLTFGADIQTHDPVNAKEMMPHSAQISAFVASLVSMAKHRPMVVANDRADWSELSSFGLEPGDQFVVLHSGARLKIKRWPMDRFIQLARILVTERGVKTILLADAPEDLTNIDVTGLPESMLTLSAAKLPFSALDSLLSLCSAFVGNDTGPKHLAALRGAPVVSVHMGQVNWSEWGQDASGLIVARRVPCVGCGIEQPEECGKGLPCLTEIKAREIFDAVISSMRMPPMTNTAKSINTEKAK